MGLEKISRAYLALGIVLFVLGFATSSITNLIHVSSGVDKQVENGFTLRDTNPDQDLIAPLLLCAESEDTYDEGALYKKVYSYIRNAMDGGKAGNVSFYYRDLTSSSWTGVNEEDHYSPASLMKVPIMMALFREVRDTPDILSKELTFTNSDKVDLIESYPGNKKIVQGETYSVTDLMKYMIENSDNNATYLLNSLVKPSSLSQLYANLGISVPDSDGNGIIDYMSARSYARFFRVLYNATYLNKRNSQKALELLSESDFKDGLRAGVPSNIKIAHKFGERTVYSSDGKSVQYRELHDCGIVYGKNPYLICVMTKGTDFGNLSKVIKDISTLTYENANK